MTQADLPSPCLSRPSLKPRRPVRARDGYQFISSVFSCKTTHRTLCPNPPPIRNARDKPVTVKTNLSDPKPRVSQRPKTRVVSRRNNKSVFLKSVFRADVCRRPLPVFICGCRDRVSTAPRIHGNGNGNGNLRVCVCVRLLCAVRCL